MLLRAKNPVNMLDDDEMLQHKENLLLETIMLFSGVGAFIVANLEIIGVTIAAVVTFFTSWYFRWRKHKRDMRLSDEKHGIEMMKLRAELVQMEKKHAQELRQDEDRHQKELDLMEQAYRKTQNNENP